MEPSTLPALLLLSALCVLPTANSALLVRAPWGALQGVEVEGDGGRKMNAFLGIPYALAPVGNLRFERPQPHPGPGEGEVFKADQAMLACPQVKYIIGDHRQTGEDCLKLDVYTPSRHEGGHNLAVMVFLHGGGFSVGDAQSYRPSRMVVDGEVIVVVLQYRLGVLGFLFTGDERVPGNMGLWDQNLALRWVRDNIQAFGGDPGRVTLFGESAGSMSVALLTLSPHSRGLFHRGILQSGAPQFLSFTNNFNRSSVFRGLTDLVGCPGQATEELLQCLKELSQEDLFNKSTEYSATSPMHSYFWPIVDGEFLPKDVTELVADDAFMKEVGAQGVDLMLGFNNQEGGILLMATNMMHLPEETLHTRDYFHGMLSSCFLAKSFKDSDILKKTVEFYYRGAELGVNMSESVLPLATMTSDCLILSDIVDLARRLANSSHSAALYLYVFDHDFVFNRKGLLPGSHHGDELVLEFDSEMEDNVFKRINKSGMAAEEEPLARMFVDVLTAFAKTGNPSPPLHDALGEEEWPMFSLDTESYLSLSPTPRVARHLEPYKDRMAFWLSLLPDLNHMVVPEPTMEDLSLAKAEAALKEMVEEAGAQEHLAKTKEELAKTKEELVKAKEEL
ncbi:hypothetical protein ACOMHN_040993 [Nucella lapillus]